MANIFRYSRSRKVSERTTPSARIWACPVAGVVHYGPTDLVVNKFFTDLVELPPTVVLNSPDDAGSTGDTTPTLNFTGSVENGETLEYEVQVDTVNTFDSQGSTPLLDKLSTDDVGFTAGHPFTSGVAVDYTTQIEAPAGTYYWRVRAKSPAGLNSFGSWSAVRSFTVSSVVVPTITTQDCTDITQTTATGNGNITATGGANATRRGFCYMTGTTGDPTTANSTAYDDGSFGTGAYTKSITGLVPNTSYRVRAYAVNSAGTSYGTTVQLTISASVYFVSSASALSTTTSVTITAPASIQNGDVMIAIVSALNSSGSTIGDITDTGWSLIGGGELLPYIKIFLFAKVADNESGNYTFGSTVANQMQGAIGLYRGCDTSNPLDGISDTPYAVSDTNVRAATVTPTAANGMFVYGGGYFTAGTISLTLPSGMNTRESQLNTNCAIGLADLAYTTASASGVKDATAGAVCTTKHACIVVLRALSTGGGYILKAYNGSAWVPTLLKYYNGSTYTEKPLKIYQSGAWHVVT